MTACKSNLKNIGTACEMYANDHERVYPENLELLIPEYLETNPECPAAGKSTYHYSKAEYGMPDGRKIDDMYQVYCSGDHHTNVSVPADYPKYNGIDGLIDR